MSLCLRRRILERRPRAAKWSPGCGVSFMTLSLSEDTSGRAPWSLQAGSVVHGTRSLKHIVAGDRFFRFCCLIERTVPLVRTAVWVLLSLTAAVYYKEFMLPRVTAWKQFFGMAASVAGGDKWALAVYVLSCVVSSA